jgi:hypothetical protein
MPVARALSPLAVRIGWSERRTRCKAEPAAVTQKPRWVSCVGGRGGRAEFARDTPCPSCRLATAAFAFAGSDSRQR